MRKAFRMGKKRAARIGFGMIAALLMLPVGLVRAEGPYDEYTQSYVPEEAPQTVSYEVAIEEYEVLEGEAQTVSDLDGSLCVETQEGSVVRWTVEVPRSDWYSIETEYYALPGRGGKIERALLLDGESPFDEAASIYFSRVFVDVGEIRQDSQGNDIRPKYEEAPRWDTYRLRDYVNYPNDDLVFYLEVGTHTITLEAKREPMALRAMRVVSPAFLPDYDTVRQEYAARGYRSATQTLQIQAEQPSAKSDPTIYALSDNASPTTTPYSATALKLNTIGREKWQAPGQWIEWEIEVPETGLYQITTRFKQNLLDGMYTSRSLSIDGEIPFREASQIVFPYADGWQTAAFGDAEHGAYEFYLEEGTHILRLDVTTGLLADTLKQASETVLILNDMYRQIIMITGPQPDTYRNYQFNYLIPDVLEEMERQAAVIREMSEELEEIAGGKGSQSAVFDKLALDLETMSENHESIAGKLEGFLSNISSLATWLTSSLNQPLELDYIELQPVGAEIPQAEKGFWASCKHIWDTFIASFVNDYYVTYEDPNGQTNESITVWITGGVDSAAGQNQASSSKTILEKGRDLSQLVREMTNDTFSPQTGIGVNVQLVPSATLLASTLAGTGPDIAFQVSYTDPVNYATRGAVVDLAQFEDFEEVAERFYPNALLPFSFNGGVYAVPETYSYLMLFYRKDIFEDLGLEVPQTWDDVYALIPELQKNNLSMGIPWDIKMFATLLYQNGLEIYAEDGACALLDQKEHLGVFQQFTELCTNYRLPLSSDFANRFRTGDMPIGIYDFTLYNQLSVFAPEIRGRWEFVPLPGVMQEDGTIDRTAATSGVGTMIMQASEHKQAAWEFLKWWTDTETQVRFAKELESQLGTAARYPTANQEAVKQLAWSNEELEQLTAQAEWTKAVPEVPGGYIMSRYVDFAFKAVVNEGEDPGEQIRRYTKEINTEIKKKRIEFGLETVD